MTSSVNHIALSKRLGLGPNVQRAVYLDAAYDLIRAELLAEAPARSSVALAFSFPPRGATTAKVIGQCHHLKKSAKKGQAVKKLLVIHPAIWRARKGLAGDNKGLEVLSVLAHEMVHAALPEGTKHKRPFAVIVERIGLEGKPTATTPGPEFKQWAEKAYKRLPKFPGGVDLSFEVKKQTTRLRLFECQCDPPVKVRVGRDEFDATCNVCEEVFEVRS